MYKRDNKKDYVVIVDEAVRGQNKLFEKVIISSPVSNPHLIPYSQTPSK